MSTGFATTRRISSRNARASSFSHSRTNGSQVAITHSLLVTSIGRILNAWRTRSTSPWSAGEVDLERVDVPVGQFDLGREPLGQHLEVQRLLRLRGPSTSGRR